MGKAKKPETEPKKSEAESPKVEAPKPAPPPEPEKKVGKRSDVKGIVEKLGIEAFNVEADNAEAKKAKIVAMFKSRAAQEGYAFDIADGTMFQYISGARSELGWTRERKSAAGGTTKTSDSGEVTISDLKAAGKLSEELGMDTTRLLEFVGKLTAFGSVQKLEASLKALQELMAD